MPIPSAPRLLVYYLLGSRNAIFQIAGSRRATIASIAFVLSAGFAREYDGENLVAEPWHALRPLAASTFSGTVLFLLVHFVTGAGRWSAEIPKPFDSYRRFMTCFWMTAPLAWFYAIPYERFLSPGEAVRANLWTLAVVSAWRVILITRVSAVLYGARAIPMFFIVMLFSDAAAFAAFALAPAPIIDIMGGMNHTERDAVLASVTFSMQFLTIISAPVWIIGSLISLAFLKAMPPELPTNATPARGWRTLAVASLVLWIIPLALVQPEQFRRTRVERLFASDNIPAALAELSRHPEEAFPRRWELPPRTGYGETFPELDTILHAVESQPTAGWVTARYAEKIDRQIRGDLTYFAYTWPDTLKNIDLRRPIPGRVSEGEITQAHLDRLAFVRAHLPSLTAEDQAAIEAIAGTIREALDAQPVPEPLPSSSSIP